MQSNASTSLIILLKNTLTRLGRKYLHHTDTIDRVNYSHSRFSILFSVHSLISNSWFGLLWTWYTSSWLQNGYSLFQIFNLYYFVYHFTYMCGVCTRSSVPQSLIWYAHHIGNVCVYDVPFWHFHEEVKYGSFSFNKNSSLQSIKTIFVWHTRVVVYGVGRYNKYRLWHISS